jgi:hypothetical protein
MTFYPQNLLLACAAALLGGSLPEPAVAEWGGWESLDGVILEQPECISWGTDRLDCFARGTDSAMYHRWWDGNAWGGWESLGGVILEQPECTSWSENRIDCFARGTDAAMHHRWWDGNAWGGWENLGGAILEEPECVSWGPDRIDCFARGTDAAMYHRWWDGSTWGGWENLGGVLLDAPNCVSWGPDRIDCFARGTDAAMYHQWWDGNAWGGWENLGGVLLDAPECVSWGPDRIDCFARGTDRAMYHRWWDGNVWGGWKNLGGVILEQPGCTSWGPNRIDCFARGTDRAMYHRWWDGSDWGGWETLGGVILDKPDCVSWGPDRIDCFARGTDRAMYHRWWDPSLVTTAQRKSANDLTEAELMSLRRGVAQMMAWNNAPRDSADFRRSWVYWANMHAHFGPACGGPISGSGMAGVVEFTASNQTEQDLWCGCEHGNVRFLTWHRMYLWYFERVLQQAAGDPALRLPFWDYVTDPTLPAAYRDPTYVDENGQTVPNPLRVEARQPALNAGTSGLLPGVASSASAMTQTTFGTFSSRLENTPHGAVHCSLVTGSCPNGLMGAVPASALDPIFYAHHTNIDRLYQCWLQTDEPNRLPNDPTHLDVRYSFIDGDGSVVERRVGDMLTVSGLGYSYAAGGGCPAMMVAMNSRGETMNLAGFTKAQEAPVEALATAEGLELERGLTTVPLQVEKRSPEMLSAQSAMGDQSLRADLIIEGVTFDEPPGTLYNVYLQSNDGTRLQVGVMSFFNMSAPQAGDHAHHSAAEGTTFTFDATEAIRQIGLQEEAQPALVFEPTTGLSGSTMETALRAVSPDANVRFNNARIEVDRSQ